MLSRQRPCGFQRLSRGFGAHFVIAVSATLMAGCSADISRFGDSPMAGLSDQSPVPAEPIRRNAGGPVDPGVWPSSGPRDSDALPQFRPPGTAGFSLHKPQCARQLRSVDEIRQPLCP